MAILIGIDEAGYGPNLGPLVVGATAWQVLEVEDQGSGNEIDLYRRLEEVVSAEADDQRIAIADSKALYKPGGGLCGLERGVLTGLGVLKRIAHNENTSASWDGIWQATGADDKRRRLELPWYAKYDCALPIDTEVDEIVALQNSLRQGCEQANVTLCDMQARAIFPQEFNQLTDHFGTKGAALSHVSIALLKAVLENPDLQSLTPAPSFITCDKHGGRNRYGALLQHHFPDEWIETVQESRAISQYRWGPSESRVTVTFRTKGEAEMPTALASMVAKYHRELAMRAFNTFWTEKIPGLKPTAGYPQDAKRFKAEIAEKQQALGIADAELWRNR